MAHAMLVVENGPLAGKGFPLIRKTLIVGRGSDCDICPEGYSELSRRHAEISWDGASFRIRDLHSANGVVVRDRKVDEGRLRDGESVALGDFTFSLKMPAGQPEFDQSEPKVAVEPPAPQRPARSTLSPATIAAVAACALALLFGIIMVSKSGSRPPSPNPHITPRPAAPDPNELSEAVLNAAKGSTVLVRVTGGDKHYSGSGFCAYRNDLIFTCAHVVRPIFDDNGNLEPDASITVVMNPGTPQEDAIPGALNTVDVKHDLAVIVAHKSTLQPMTISDLSTLHETQSCWAVGFPAVASDIRSSYPEPSIQQVQVQKICRNDLDQINQIQFGGTVTHGNSGGPIIDAAGNVVGVVDREGRDPTQPLIDPQTAAGISIAVSSNLVKSLYASLQN